MTRNYFVWDEPEDGPVVSTLATAVTTTKMSESFLSVTSEKSVSQGQNPMSIPISLPLSRLQIRLGLGSDITANAFNEPLVDLGKA